MRRIGLGLPSSHMTLGLKSRFEHSKRPQEGGGKHFDHALRRKCLNPPTIPQNTTLCCPISRRYSQPEQLILPVSMMQNCVFRFFHLVFFAKWKKFRFRSIRPRHDSPGLKVGWWFMLSSDLDTPKYSLDPTNLRGPSIRKLFFGLQRGIFDVRGAFLWVEWRI